MNGSRAKKIVKMMVDDPGELIRLRILQFPVTNQGNEKEERNSRVFTTKLQSRQQLLQVAVPHRSI